MWSSATLTCCVQLELLLAHPRIDAARPFRGLTALQWAVSKGRTELEAVFAAAVSISTPRTLSHPFPLPNPILY